MNLAIRLRLSRYGAVTVEHRMFAYDEFMQTVGSVITVPRLFRLSLLCFIRGLRDPVPSRNTFLRWIHNLRATRSIVEKKSPSTTNTAPENTMQHRGSENRAEPWALCT